MAFLLLNELVDMGGCSGRLHYAVRIAMGRFGWLFVAHMHYCCSPGASAGYGWQYFDGT